MSLRHLKIAHKLPLLMTGLATISAAITGYIAVNRATQDETKAFAEKLMAIEESRTVALENYLRSITEDLSSMAYSDHVRQALYDFSDGWNGLAVNQTTRLQKLYIKDNPNPTGKKEELDKATDDSLYTQMHAKYHPWFRHFLRQRAYYDIFLFDRDGNIVYSVFKELDFATNVVSGEWADTDIAHVFREARNNPTKDFQVFADFKPYAPSNNVPAAFIAQPILTPTGVFAGVIAFQMPIGRINEIMQNSVGMGETGESYIVGADRLMRSDSRFLKEGEASSILRTKVTEEAISKALASTEEEEKANKDDYHFITDYRGVPVLSAYGTVDFLGTQWVTLAEMDKSEVMEPVYAMQRSVILTTLLGLLGVSVIGVFASRSISRPISRMTDAMRDISKENYDIGIPGIGRRDEIGDMATAVQVFKENGLETKRLREEQVINERRAAEEKKRLMQEMADNFDAQVGGTIQSLSTAAEQLQAAAKAMEHTASETTEASTSVAGASEETSANVNTVASATEEMAASAQEISVQVSSVARRSSEAATSASNTSQKVNELNALVSNIGEVVNAIKDIAEQTNLLALNATIEAARAGEAGKGFAVVADEVKKLASETARKTEEIESRITQIQSATQASVMAMQDIIKGISDIDGMSASAAGAVEEQNAVLAEITRNISEVSQAAQEVASSISQVRSAAGESAQTAVMLKSSADEIAGLSASLDSSVKRFLAEVRAG